MFCGLTLSCCSVAGWRIISDIQHFHFGLLRAARAAAAVTSADAATAAVLALAWTGTAGPCFHEDNSAVIFGAEVRAV